jgi:hypothetical protein
VRNSGGRPKLGLQRIFEVMSHARTSVAAMAYLEN